MFRLVRAAWVYNVVFMLTGSLFYCSDADPVKDNASKDADPVPDDAGKDADPVKDDASKDADPVKDQEGSALDGLNDFSFIVETPENAGHVPGRPKLEDAAVAYEAQAGDIRIDFKTTSDLPIGCVAIDSRDIRRSETTAAPTRLALARAVDGDQAVSPSVLNSVEIVALTDDAASRMIVLSTGDDDGYSVPIAGGATAVLPIVLGANGKLDASGPVAESVLYRRGRALYHPTAEEIMGGEGRFIIRTGVSSTGGSIRATVYCSLFQSVHDTAHGSDLSDIGGLSTDPVVVGAASPAENAEAQANPLSDEDLENFSLGYPPSGFSGDEVLGLDAFNLFGFMRSPPTEGVALSSSSLNKDVKQGLGRGDSESKALPGVGVLDVLSNDVGYLHNSSRYGLRRNRAIGSRVGEVAPDTTLVSCLVAWTNSDAPWDFDGGEDEPGANAIESLMGSRKADGELNPSPYALFAAVYDAATPAIDLTNRFAGTPKLVSVVATGEAAESTLDGGGSFAPVRATMMIEKKSEDADDFPMVSFNMPFRLAAAPLENANRTVRVMCTIGTPGSLSPIFIG